MNFACKNSICCSKRIKQGEVQRADYGKNPILFEAKKGEMQSHALGNAQALGIASTTIQNVFK